MDPRHDETCKTTATLLNCKLRFRENQTRNIRTMEQFECDFYQTDYSFEDAAQGLSTTGASSQYDQNNYRTRKQEYLYSGMTSSSLDQPGYICEEPSYAASDPPYGPPQYIFQPSDNFEDEPPLLEELGINFNHIWQKTLTVLNPWKPADGSIMNETDLTGPLMFSFALGSTLLQGRSILATCTP
ncbi:protein YIPF7 isoform X4 [Rana temporaria]|uniref:protein YIPF7 isoform X4 n=1 Tax=Rana temporaria TaxID=8407 RepID=UPI001AACFDC3|nr:protein YIPF7 isoform X4 [Rana temporaria]